MLIDVIDTLDAFARVRTDWDDAYDADPEAQFFLSWTWMSKWLPMLAGPWFVLAAKPAAQARYVAFFPLRTRLREKADGNFYNEITMAGNFAADYTGLVCHPDHAGPALAAFAAHLKRRHWMRLNFDYLRMSPERQRAFFVHFPAREFRTRTATRVNEADNIDNCICPSVTLPDDWEHFLASRLSANMRQKLRRFLRRVESDSAFRITHADADTLERDLKMLLRFWTAKWGDRKGRRLPTILDSNYNMLRRCAETGALFLPVLWHGERPLGALASLIDARKKSLLFYIAGRDESFNDPPPGLVLHAYSIRHAIGQGITTYDFLRGNEPYKYSFGAQEHTIACIALETRNERNLGERLEPASLPAAFKRASEWHQAGKLVEAERGYRLILDSDPRHAQALYCLGQLMMSRNKHGTAKRLFTTLTKIRPDSEKAWAWLARALEERQHLAEAADAYRRIIALNPASATAHHKLGLLQARLNRFPDAMASFDAALKLAPGHAEAIAGRADALAMLNARAADTGITKAARRSGTARRNGESAVAQPG